MMADARAVSSPLSKQALPQFLDLTAQRCDVAHHFGLMNGLRLN
jgi:hypothetical protein